MDERRRGAAKPIDLELVREFCDIVEAHGLARLDVSYKDFSLRVSRATHAGVELASALESTATLTSSTLPAAAPPARPKLPENIIPVKSPLAGVFYRAVRPGASPFVNEGDEVRLGQTLCIIEAMKLMNEITADADASVYRILVENAQVVEAGQDIILLQPLIEGI